MDDRETAVQQGALYVYGGHALMVGCAVDNPPHSHYNASVLIASGAPFLFRHGEGVWQQSHGLCVAPCVVQQLRTCDAGVLIMQVDPDGSAFRHFGGRFAAAPVIELAADERAAVLAGVPAGGWYGSAAVDFFRHAMAVLGRDAPRPRPRDPRVVSACRMLAGQLEKPPSLAALAAAVSLSVSRLQHLVKAELGLPLGHYLLWLRVRDTVRRAQQGSSLTDAALAAGFADSAHFSRTFRRMFGLPPSSVLKQRGQIQVQILSSATGCNEGCDAAIEGRAGLAPGAGR